MPPQDNESVFNIELTLQSYHLFILSDANSTARQSLHQVHKYRSVRDAVGLDLSHSAMP